MEQKDTHRSFSREAGRAINQYSYAYDFSEYQTHRQSHVPGTPAALAAKTGERIMLHEEPSKEMASGLDTVFPTLIGRGMKYYELRADPKGSLAKSDKPVMLGCVLSGGQAPGGHNVIMGMFDMAKKLHPDSKLYGFLAGPHGVYTGNYMEITEEYMALYRNMGGFDMIRAGRHKIETPDQFASSLDYCNKLGLDGLAVIGGDDSNTNACLLAEYFAKHGSKCAVVGCPKTIDGDLRNEHIAVSFGFDTATKVYAEGIGNLCTDAVSSRKYYYFVRLMGRSASHIALECALQTRINWLLVGEEVEQKQYTLEDITMQLADLICKRAQRAKHYGVILVPEGLIEFIPEVKVLIAEINEILAGDFKGDIQEHVVNSLSEGSRGLFNRLPRSVANQLLLDRDPHGNVQVSKIDTERLLILLVMRELENRRRSGVYSGTFKPQSHFFGYEGRCALPSNFDAQYCYSLGMTAAYLMLQKCSGYMSCVKNLGDPNPANWVAAGCPLPTMMGMERRKGKDKPVITKALVELDQPMFKCYEAVRKRWAVLDCYQSPGPIQFKGAGSNLVNYMVKAPDVDAFVYETDVQERYERRHEDDVLFRQESSLSVLSRARIRAEVAVPAILRARAWRLTAIKKYSPLSQQASSHIEQEFPQMSKHRKSSYFVEVQDRQLSLYGTRHYEDGVVESLNEEFAAFNHKTVSNKFAVLLLGSAAPGGNNIIDGLLKFQSQRQNTTLVGYINGVDGLRDDKILTITEESFAPYRNLGGYDYLGRSQERLTSDDFSTTAASCKKHGITGLILVGATHTLSDGARLSEHFLETGVGARVVAIPATLDGNIRHTFLQTSLGFDTASKVYSQLIGNMLTDSASAIKYWYFIRLMGKNPSHLALECALKTHPNMVIISEECAQRGEALNHIVDRICDVVAQRAAQGKNFGTILLPEGLLSHLSAYGQLIGELNALFEKCQDNKQKEDLSDKLLNDESHIKDCLSPWSYSLYATLPDFMKLQLINEQEISGELNLSQVETEKLLAHFVAEELAKRKKAGTYGGTFAPVTHFFGYQGRAAHPSLFDCSLASTMGFGAAALLEAGCTGLAVGVKEITSKPEAWRVGGVPLLSLLTVVSKPGHADQAIIASQEVRTQDLPYQILKKHEPEWRFIDHYVNPGPIQYQDFGCESSCDTVRSQYQAQTDVADQIKGLCKTIHDETMFADHPHLLIAALSSLRSAKVVLSSARRNKELQGMLSTQYKEQFD